VTDTLPSGVVEQATLTATDSAGSPHVLKLTTYTNGDIRLQSGLVWIVIPAAMKADLREELV
jgi:hypothetical protein